MFVIIIHEVAEVPWAIGPFASEAEAEAARVDLIEVNRIPADEIVVSQLSPPEHHDGN